MQSTVLSTILSRMNRWQDIERIEEQFKIRDLDNALREQKREINPPWTLRKRTLRIFSGVVEYPVADDHDELAFLEPQNIESYRDSARFYNTSIKQFVQQVNSTRNLLSEIWKDGSKILGVNYKTKQVGSQLLSTAEVASDYTASEDASDITKDNVVAKKGNSSIRFNVVNSAGMAVVKNTFTAFLDTKYKNKYHFRYIYLGGVPTSIDLRLQTDDSNYLTGNITTQFGGQALKINDWNLIAVDLNTATEVGSFDNTSIASEMVILNDAPTGVYYLDESSIKEWELFDYWYYGLNSIITLGNTSPDQKYLFNSSEVYSTDSKIVGDDEWIDAIMYDAMLVSINEKENSVIYQEIKGRREKAWTKLTERYPSMVPVIVTQKYRFNHNPGGSGYYNRNI